MKRISELSVESETLYTTKKRIYVLYVLFLDMYIDQGVYIISFIDDSTVNIPYFAWHSLTLKSALYKCPRLSTCFDEYGFDSNRKRVADLISWGFQVDRTIKVCLGKYICYYYAIEVISRIIMHTHRFTSPDLPPQRHLKTNGMPHNP